MRSSDAGCLPARGPELPLLCIGDSDMAQGYLHIEDCDPSVRLFNPMARSAYHNWCHSGGWEIRDEIGALGPRLGNGFLRGSYTLDLGLALTNLGIPVALLEYAIGSTSFNDYSPSLSPANYAARLAWFKARLDQMPGHLDPILLCDHGMAGQPSPLWHVAAAETFAALRTDLGYPNMKICQIKAPLTAGDHVGAFHDIYSLQIAYAETDPLCRLAWNDATTYVGDASLTPGMVGNGVGAEGSWVHFDAPSGRKLAIGPDDSTTTSIITVLRQMIGR
jgi:hypothetical protein